MTASENERGGTLPKNTIPYLIIFSFLTWVFLFRGFLLNQFPLHEDAIPYYNHFKFFIDNINQGIFPLWDPVRDGGVPNDFFLRRIGAFNPVFLYLIILTQIGVSFIYAYLSFLGFYYFLGMVGFYMIARQFWGHPSFAFLAYLLLMFSSLGTKLFDSYILFTFIPMVWFFYFFIAFSKIPQRYSFLGIVMTLMILMNTYVPFYFVTIFLTFFIWYAILYIHTLKSIAISYYKFFKDNKILVGLGLSALALSLLPGIMFFLEAGQGEISLPRRHYYSTAQNVLQVDIKTIEKWAIVEEVLFSKAFWFENIHRFQFAVLHIPIVAIVLLLLGISLKINRRLIFLFLWGFSIFY